MLLGVPRRFGERDGNVLSIASPELEKPNTVNKRVDTNRIGMVNTRTLWGLWLLSL